MEAARGMGVTLDGQAPALQVEPVEAFAPKLDAAVEPDFFQQVGARLGAGILRVAAAVLYQRLHQGLHVGVLAAQAAEGFGLDEVHLRRAEVIELAHAGLAGAEELELHVGVNEARREELRGVVAAGALQQRAGGDATIGRVVGVALLWGEEHAAAHVGRRDAVVELLADGAGITAADVGAGVATLLGEEGVVVERLVGSAVAAPDPFTVGRTEPAVHVVGVAHQRIVLACQGGILGGCGPVLARQGGTGIDGIGHGKVEAVVVVAGARQAAARIAVDGGVEVGIDLRVYLRQGRSGQVAVRRVDAQGQAARGALVAVRPAVAVELAEHQVGVGADGECLCTDEEPFFFRPHSLVDVSQDAVGVAHELIIVEPRIVAVEHGVTFHVRGVDDGRPSRQVALLEVVAGIVSIPGLDGPLAVDALLSKVLLGHHEAEAVDGHAGVFGRFEDGARVGRRLRQGVEVVGRTGRQQRCRGGQEKSIFQFHTNSVFTVLQSHTHSHGEDARRHEVIALSAIERLLGVHALSGGEGPEVLAVDVQSHGL